MQEGNCWAWGGGAGECALYSPPLDLPLLESTQLAIDSADKKSPGPSLTLHNNNSIIMPSIECSIAIIDQYYENSHYISIM